ncbi:MAG: glycerol-3-phosphate acyltransferase [candidate division WOR-3 bacterium]
MIARLAWVIAGYLSGSLMFSYWRGRLAGQDIRRTGDGNPGAANVFRSSGWLLGVPALVLDNLKGGVPVFLAVRRFGLSAYIGLRAIWFTLNQTTAWKGRILKGPPWRLL